MKINGVKSLGSLLANFVQLDDCFKAEDGICAGDKLGTFSYLLLDPTAYDIYDYEEE